MTPRYNRDLFEIAVYARTRGDWYEQLRQRVEATAAERIETYERAGLAVDAALRERAEREARECEHPYGWQYNDVVGWIRLTWNGPGPKVLAFLWPVGARYTGGYRRQSRFPWRRFQAFPFLMGDPMNRLFELWAEQDESDDAFRKRLRRRLVGLTEQGRDLEGKVLDLRAFDHLSPHVRWRDAISPNESND